MVLQPKASRGLLAAATLLLVFLVVQGLVRWLLAYLVSRFAPLVPIARRIRVDAVLDSSGAISLNPMNVNPSHNDEGFALENTESVQSFSVFGYDFSVSVLRTFLRSTVAPLGQVNSPGKFVIGSRGYVRSKDQTDTSTGNVSLTLRGQWVVGVKSDDMQRLINGETSVAAEVVAFLEPYEQGQGRDEQISDLAFGISADSFATQFLELVEGKRKEAFEANEGDVEAGVPTPASTVDTAATDPDSINDPFGTAAAAPASGNTNRNEQPRRRGRRSRRDVDDISEPEQSNQPTEWDPFA